MEPSSSSSPNKAIIGIIVVVLLVVAATAVIVLGSAKNDDTASTAAGTSVSPSASPATDSQASASSEFKDGTYSATGSYQTPGGRETIGVKVTLAGGTVIDAAITEQGKTGESQEYQSKFASGFKSEVVGKKIDTVSLSRVAGSSLTPNGFNDAIDDIKQQAEA